MEVYFEHNDIESTYLLSAGWFTHSFIASLGFKTQDVKFWFHFPERLISPGNEDTDKEVDEGRELERAQ